MQPSEAALFAGRWTGECELHRVRAATPSLRRLRVVIDASRGLIRACLQLVSAGARRVAQRLDFSLSQWTAPTAYGWRQTPSTRQAVYARKRK